MTSNDYGRAYQSGFKRTIRFLTAKGISYDVAEEAAQAAWTRGWERIGQLRNELVIKTWVNKIALNIYRRDASVDRREQPLTDLSVREETRINTAAIDLGTLLGLCCPADQALLVRKMHGWTTGEIARASGASETAIRIRLMRARRAARSKLAGTDQNGCGNPRVLERKTSEFAASPR